MLILARKLGEKLLIGDDIVVEVVALLGDKVRLGITAPPYVSVDREEVRKKPDYKPNKIHGGSSNEGLQANPKQQQK